MKAFILAAGLGTRLRPWTEKHPKALVPVGGEPMLKWVILKLKREGFNRLVINVHHFADQIEDYLRSHDFGVEIDLSRETDQLLETGGGIVKARRFLCSDKEPFLIHNVDILSDARLDNLMKFHIESGNSATLLVSDRSSSRKLLFDSEMKLRGWHNLKTEEFRPGNISGDSCRKRIAEGELKEYAFSGIHVMNPEEVEKMMKEYGECKFSVMDYYLGNLQKGEISGYKQEGIELIDIGKPETLEVAERIRDKF